MKIAALRQQREAKRAAFLALLAKTANVSLSVREAGLRMSSVYHHRRANPDFERAWQLALQRGREALASGWASELAEGREGVVGRAADGSPILKEARWDQWNPDKERRFFEALGQTNNIRLAARAADIRTGSIYTRRKLWPEFAKAMAETQRRAVEAFSARLAETGSPTLVPVKIPHHVETRIDTVEKAIRTVEQCLPELRHRPPVKHRKGRFSRARRGADPSVERLLAALMRSYGASAAQPEASIAVAEHERTVTLSTAKASAGEPVE